MEINSQDINTPSDIELWLYTILLDEKQKELVIRIHNILMKEGYEYNLRTYLWTLNHEMNEWREDMSRKFCERYEINFEELIDLIDEALKIKSPSKEFGWNIGSTVADILKHKEKKRLINIWLSEKSIDIIFHYYTQDVETILEVIKDLKYDKVKLDSLNKFLGIRKLVNRKNKARYYPAIQRMEESDFWLFFRKLWNKYSMEKL